MKKALHLLLLLTIVLSALTLSACLFKEDDHEISFKSYQSVLENAIKKTCDEHSFQLTSREETTIDGEVTVKTLTAEGDGYLKKSVTTVTDAQGKETSTTVCRTRIRESYFQSETVTGSAPIIRSVDKEKYDSDTLSSYLQICEVSLDKNFLSVINKGYHVVDYTHDGTKHYQMTEGGNGDVALTFYELDSKQSIVFIIRSEKITDIKADFTRNKTFDKKLSGYLRNEYEDEEPERTIKLTIHIDYESVSVTAQELDDLSLLISDSEKYDDVEYTPLGAQFVGQIIDHLSQTGRRAEWTEGNFRCVSESRDKVVRKTIYDGDTMIDESYFYVKDDTYYMKNRISTGFREVTVKEENYDTQLNVTRDALIEIFSDVLPATATKKTIVVGQEKTGIAKSFLTYDIIAAYSQLSSIPMETGLTWEDMDSGAPLVSYKRYEDNALVEEAAICRKDEASIYCFKKRYENGEETIVSGITVSFGVEPIEVPE